MVRPLKILHSGAGMVPGVSPPLQGANRALGKLCWWLLTLPSQGHLKHLSLAKVGAFEALQPTLHREGLLGHLPLLEGGDGV